MSETTDLKRNANGIVETVKVVVQALLLALVVRTFFYQPFNIPSGSMKSTLLVGDYLFVSKFSYGYSQYSIPYAAIPFSGRVFGSEPKRGDVAVFKLPRDNETDYIKRVIGLPGDRVQMKGGQLFINGQPVPREKVGQIDNPDITEVDRPVDVYRETLPNGVAYDTLDLTPNSIGDETREFVVPAGHYFMMGDNRDNSTDSRFTRDVGPVPFENLIGRAEIIFFSIDGVAWQFWNWPWSIRWNRLLGTL